MESTNNIASTSKPVLRTWVNLGANWSETVVGSSLAAVRDVHGLWKDRFSAVVDFVEGTQRGTNDLVRNLVGRMDKVIETSLRSTEEAVFVVIRGVQSTANIATEAAAKAGSTMVSGSVSTGEQAA